MPPELSIIVPTYNDRERVVITAREIVEYFKANDMNAELLVVDDGSEPGHGAQPEEFGDEVQFIQNPENLGKGGAIRTGMMAARGAKIVFMDSDLPFTLEPLPKTIELLDDNDIVIGDRLHPESSCATEVTAMRKLSSNVFTMLVNFIMGLNFKDTQCGYKGFRSDIARELFGAGIIDSFAFDVEILLIACRRKLKIVSQPVRLVNNESTTVRLGKHSLQILRDLIRVRWRDLTGKYRQ
jgi:dolichyl-phosphate beta-glucosyltransferase